MADHFEEEEYNAEKFSFDVWKKIFKTVLISKRNIIIMIISIVFLACLDICVPLLNAYAIEHFFEAKDYSTLKPFIIIYVLFGVCFGFAVFVFINYAGKVESRTSYELRKQAYNKLQELPFSYFDRTPTGWIMARMTSDSRKLSNIISWGIVDFLWGFLMMFGILIVLYIKNYKLALIVTALLPIMIIVAIFFRKRILVSHRKARKINSQITASYNEGFTGNKTTKSLVIEENNSLEFQGLVYNYRKNSLRAILLSSIFSPIMLILSYVGVSLIMISGANMQIKGLIDVALLYLCIDYTTRFFEPVMQIARLLAEFQQAQASAERVVSLIETAPEIYDTDEVTKKYGDLFHHKKENWEQISGEIDFKNVTFRYNQGEKVLDTFNLHVKAGQTIALVGHTGAGKSTIVNLLCRFYEPTTGEILIDGKNYKDRSISWLHSQLGYVLQSPHLFSGTIKENIRYGNLNATDEEIIAAAKVVDAHEFIMGLENNYDTSVGEGGNKLSLGQKQLVSFARAIIADPKILILDEATSSIDTQTEDKIQKAIDVLLENRTSFVIAHRLSTVRNADVIILLKDGKILEQGNHLELLKLNGHYYNLYKNQFIKELEQANILDGSNE